MRNLKRALSLALASVMLLGMMVVGTSAASYTDVDENDNVEAIEVLNAVEVMIGRQGNFEPTEAVNRHEMAVIMAKLVLGVETADNYVGTHPFTDVVPWADKYVAACYENGLIAGTSATTYGGSQPLTAVQAAAMMLRALGYEDLSKGATDWRAPVTAAANRIRLFQGVASNPSQKLNRNEVAQLALNTLKSPVVDTKEGLSVTGSNGDYTFTIDGNREYIARSSREAYARAINAVESQGTSASSIGGYTIELGEHLYNGKLKLNTNAKDKFGRPSNNWQYDGKDIGTYVNNDLKVAEYKTGVTGAAMFELLTYTTINENALLTWVDGVSNNDDITKNDLARSNKNDLADTGTGVLTEVFVDLDHDEVTISSINTYLAKANSDYNSTNESLSLKVYQSSATGTTKIVDSKDVPEAAGVKKDEYKLVYMSGWDTSATQLEVVNIFDVEIMNDSSVTKWSKSDDQVVDKLTTGGTEYKSNPKAYYDKGGVFDDYDNQLLTDNTYNVYLDRYGNVIGVDLHEGTKNYVFIAGYDRGASHISVKTADAAAIFMDGTVDVITVNVTDTNKNIRNARAEKDSDGVLTGNYYEYAEWGQVDASGDTNLNRWYTYTVANNGTYTLKPVKNFLYTSADELNTPTDDDPKTLNSANLFLDDSSDLTSKGRVYGEDASVYITVDVDDVDYTSILAGDGQAITDVKGVYTGAQNVKIDLKPEYQGVAGKTVNWDKTGSDAQESTAEQDAYVYTVFDGNGYIIASVLLGEAQGATTNYAYILGDAKSERIEREGNAKAAGDVTYYWEFDAVYNGEKTTLQAKTKYPADLLLRKWTIQEVRFDGEYVTDLKKVKLSDTFYYDNAGKPAGGRAIEDMKIYDAGALAGTAWQKTSNDSVIGNGGFVHNASLAQDDAANTPVTDNKRIDGTIYLQGRTLYVDNSNGGREIGLALASDAKAVLVQPENGKVESAACGSVAEALGRLADRDPEAGNTQFRGRIAAVLDSAGVAQWVVIISDSNLVTGGKPDYSGGSGSSSTDYYEFNYRSGNTGRYSGTLIAKRPEWLASTVALKANYEVWVNGEWAYDDDVTIGIGDVRATNPVGGNDVDANPTVEIRNFKWDSLAGQDYNIKWSINGSEVTVPATSTSTTDKFSHKTTQKVNGTTGAAVKGKLNTAVYTAPLTVDWTATGLYDGTKAVTGATGVTTNAGCEWKLGASLVAAKADGTALEDYVRINVTVPESAVKPITYKLNEITVAQAIGTAAGIDTSYTGLGKDLTVTVTSTDATKTAMANGYTIPVTVTPGNALGATEKTGATVVITVGDVDFTFDYTNSATVPAAQTKLVTVKGADLSASLKSVTSIAAPSVSRIVVSDKNTNGVMDIAATGFEDTITIYFDKELKETTNVATTIGTVGHDATLEMAESGAAWGKKADGTTDDTSVLILKVSTAAGSATEENKITIAGGQLIDNATGVKQLQKLELTIKGATVTWAFVDP